MNGHAIDMERTKANLVANNESVFGAKLTQIEAT